MDHSEGGSSDTNGTLDQFRPLGYGVDSPQFTPQFGSVVNFLPTGDIAHSVPYGGPNRSRYWDPRNFSHETTFAIGAKWDHDFGDGWKLSNNLRVQQNRVEHTYASDIGYQSVTNSLTFTQLGTGLAGLSNTPGIYTLTNRNTGDVLARVRRLTTAAQAAACASPVAGNNGYCLDAATPNRLPNQSIVNPAPIDSNNLILTVGSNNSSGVIRSRDVMDLFTLTKSNDWLTVTTGVYFGQSRFKLNFSYGGRGVMPLQNNPFTMGVTFTTTTASTAGGPAGTTYQLTDPTGFGALGSSIGITSDDYATTREISPLLGITIQPTANWLIDGGARYTFYRGWGQTKRYVTNPSATSRAFGGFDGNPLTIYDNVYAVDTPASTFPFNKAISYLQYSGAVSYFANSHASAFLRYTKGRKNQDRFWDGFAISQALVNQYSLAPLPVITQVELGSQLRYGWFTLNPVLYFVDLNNVPIRRNDGRSADGVTTYITQAFYSHYQSMGLELDNTVRFASWFNIRNVLTLNRGRSLKQATVNLGTCNGVPTPQTCPNGIQPQDDDFATYLSGVQERSANVTYNGTANVQFGNFGAYYRFRYISERPISVLNTFRLPAQELSDIGLRYDLTPTMTVNFNVNNLFNNVNPTQLSQVGNRPSNLTEEQFIQQYPNALVAITTNTPRSYFLTLNTSF
ncbi:hypothetical protein AVM11_09510 [Sphingomonas melonis TY]|jgi:iron complex outermembrane recepter protein|uniref:TonB-dependent receptor-like beta-barrel domain-containing protein n=1 Tax=Sphingomonas melonis TY TaxID=621456 RepID=A0A175Y0C6_9SPHN|nr:TonB-dependent receptor [Sphingomonas melonis]AOW25337.1 hypothetical protein BJP26_18800 [Sphingomonas melonis TY]KZB93885.1 hypothetical protein AVM11_09510 [Sphingomonas melonis TY]